MKKVLSVILLMALVFSLCACDERTVLNVYNCSDYIGEGVLEEFEKQNPDIRINYEMFDSNESLYNKISHSSSKYDVIVPSDYMIERMMEENLLSKIDLNNIPNYQQYVPETFRNLSFDPNNEYAVPYTWGTVGILYNKTLVSEEEITWDLLWDPKYENQVIMYDSERDSIAVALSYLGYSINTTNTEELNEAKDVLIAQVPNVLAYFTDLVRDKMVSGDAALAVVYSGDAALCLEENEDLAYAVPKSGSNIFYDCMCIPHNAEHKNEAERFINFMLEPEIARKNATMGYCMPHSSVYDDVDFRDKYALYPDEETINRCEIYKNLPQEINELLGKIWTEVKLAAE